MTAKLYRMYWLKYLKVPCAGNVNRVNLRVGTWGYTHFTCKAQTLKEAIRKGTQFWKDADLGGAFIMKEEIKKEKTK